VLGITSYGVHIPRYRLSKKIIAAAWGNRGSKGERAVANFDEDSLTMGVSAGIDCLRNSSSDLTKVKGLYFASTSPSYREKLSSSLIATVLDLPPRIRTADFSGSLRSSTSALRCALDAVQCQSAGDVLVIASDCRLAQPGSNLEETLA